MTDISWDKACEDSKVSLACQCLTKLIGIIYLFSSINLYFVSNRIRLWLIYLIQVCNYDIIKASYSYSYKVYKGVFIKFTGIPAPVIEFPWLTIEKVIKYKPTE